MLSNTEAGNSTWSEYKILATNMEPEYLKNEYAEIYARGTGARNHNTSIVKIDNYTLLDHGLFRGLYLIVLSRKDLKKVYSGWYDLMKREESYSVNIIKTWEVNETCYNETDCILPISATKDTTAAGSTTTADSNTNTGGATTI